jgi:hypothetical protein
LIAAIGNATESSVSGTALAAGFYQITSLETRVAIAQLAMTFDPDLKRKGASPPVSARNLHFLTGQLALFRFKRSPLD